MLYAGTSVVRGKGSAVIVATGQWDKAYNALFSGGSFSSLASNILMIAIILGALAVVIFGAKKKATS